MKRHVSILTLLVLITTTSALGAAIKSYTSVLNGPTVDFENLSNGTLVSTQYAGMTFGQAPTAGRPMIDEFPWLFGYGSSSGNHVLTGSTEGGYPFPTIAGITIAFDTPQRAVQAFLSDTAPLGDYTITAFGAGGSVLESFVVLASEVLPPGYNGGTLPPPGTTPLPGIYVGFMNATSNIFSIQIGGSSAFADAFAIDDVTLSNTNVGTIPEPGTWVLLTTGLASLVAYRRRRLR